MSGSGYAKVDGFFLPLGEKSKSPVFRVPADNFVETLRVNVDNEKLSDKEFRDFVRKTLPIVEGVK